jgi:hypothetical protein
MTVDHTAGAGRVVPASVIRERQPEELFDKVLCPLNGFGSVDVFAAFVVLVHGFPSKNNPDDRSLSRPFALVLIKSEYRNARSANGEQFDVRKPVR